VPGSVRDIQVAGLDSLMANRWLLGFTIDSSQIGAIVTQRSLGRTSHDDFKEMVDRSKFLMRIPWAHGVRHASNAQFYSRIETDGWVCLVVETNSSRAWFISEWAR
jgi:hypothetical protein